MRVVQLQIEDIAFGGKGVGRDQGKAVFVPYVVEGERVSAEIVREKKQFAEAELVEVLEPSGDRVSAPCPYFARCGGCAYQQMTYSHQLATKSRQVGDVLRRIGKFRDVPTRPIIPSPKEYGYRNRITVHAQDGVIGFFRRDSNRLIDIERCPISEEEVNRQLADLRAQNPRDGHYTLRAGAGPRVFSQTNDEVGDALRALVDAMIPSGQDLLIDAFCGAGFFAKALLPKFQRVLGIDWDRFAIAEAKKNATEKETYIAGDVAAELAKVGAVHRTARNARENAPDGRLGSIAPTLIADPPATGLTNEVRAAVLALEPKTFIYISCNPATLARDLREFADAYQIQSVTPLDMFPQTAEIEVAAHLTRKPADRSLLEAN